MSFPDAVFAALRAEPSKIAVEHGSREVTRAELLGLTSRIAAGMRVARVKRGSGVAMITDVTPEALAAYLAAWALGARVVGIRPGFSDKQLDHMLSDGLDLVVTDAKLPELLDTPDEPLILTSRPGDVARLVYTSGSTGLPKGCVQTYGALSAHYNWNPDNWDAATIRLAAACDRYLLFGSLASVVVQDYLALCLLHGGTAVIPEELRFPDVLSSLRITFTIMNVPRLYAMLDSLRDNPLDMSSLQGMIVAGSPLTPHRLAEAQQRLGPVVYQGYGQSETNGLTILTPEEGHQDSVGRLQGGVEIEIRDGEVWARNPWMMREYWENPAETAEVVVDGWVRTRDLGELRDGYLYLTGRTRDVVIVNGYPVYAGPIERVLAQHPDVDQAYVLGPEEVLHAFVIPLAGREPSIDELSSLVRDELGPDSVPTTITFVDEVPVAPSGKPDKKALLG
ncbi:acyl-CoA synthetase (AMP-forming)/AMP-acid ligase II [Kibdelosporangium banguiense]|uniref:Acyl-CoA synthetase (AMP-forming)/AMP-acid ligase II n=1 Tax=Kibdelosporangium banguiense TaxID=1365924 RepID=A0ABS4T952_9PSEU|nr:fatty acid--CoA ligase family protein [Kibdelosporangium banguiense]MBP2320959.1 acyl-CoA synthetase (AMP-forming)/AMP-acid ligase II [Kibdelosporangium banguiense]